MSENHPTRRRFQFSLATLLLIVVPVSLLAGALGGMLRTETDTAGLPRSFFVILAIMVPIGLMIVASIARSAIGWFVGRNRSR